MQTSSLEHHCVESYWSTAVLCDGEQGSTCRLYSSSHWSFTHGILISHNSDTSSYSSSSREGGMQACHDLRPVPSNTNRCTTACLAQHGPQHGTCIDNMCNNQTQPAALKGCSEVSEVQQAPSKISHRKAAAGLMWYKLMQEMQHDTHN